MFKLLLSAILISSSLSAFASDQSKVNFTKEQKVKKLKTLEADPERTVVLEGVIEKVNADTVIDEMNELAKKNNKPIYLMIDSPGGRVEAGFDIIDTIKSLKEDKNLKVICGVKHQAASMAAFITAYCYETYVQRQATILFHQIQIGVQGPILDVKDALDVSLASNSEISEDIAAQLGMTTKDYLEKVTRRDWEMTATQAAKIGMIDGVLDYLVYTKPKPPENPLEALFKMILGGQNSNPTVPNRNR